MIKLVIHMLAYNHEKYIEEAIDSILMQEVNFDYKIIIGEDCSTDNTREILKDYKQRFPDKIKLILHEKNVGASLNCLEVSKNCNSEYIAYLEGDDFWTDKTKLQKSIDFLENNSDYIATAHDVSIIDENRKLLSDTPFGSYKGDLKTPLDQFKYNNLPTLSLVFKNIWGEDYSVVRNKLLKDVEIVGDYPFKLLLLTKGKIKYFSENMGTYRWIRDSGSSFSAQTKNNPNLFRIDMVNSLANLSNMDTNYSKLFNTELKKIECEIILNYICTFNIPKLKDFMKKYVSKNSSICKVKMFVWIIIIFFYKLLKKILKSSGLYKKK
ncbi:glycosyltransferase [Clostridium sp. CM027]|uniref:glycosyltransferase n=1 Tax=Clostridium sp. CM027 TaxID=2849865 RepID=UPI001C6DE35E|nr:glycosyltransferase [Clostridium sp. CM027]MBW9144846.1 glycosyltransferase [Clostridium sp. CM027]UVE40413.1 glycosyltransferase [Clostridium sp. CM027]